MISVCIPIYCADTLFYIRAREAASSQSPTLAGRIRGYFSASRFLCSFSFSGMLERPNFGCLVAKRWWSRRQTSRSVLAVCETLMSDFMLLQGFVFKPLTVKLSWKSLSFCTQWNQQMKRAFVEGRMNAAGVCLSERLKQDAEGLHVYVRE